ncbi:protein GET1 [Paracoccidioides brasiliensis]|uniref:Protein GET1 n=1 Tax=Paracoccidioides brasiliensis TaxID=121759 RepID=A0A1D2JBC2_PARBR|nr:protein GET1 [Paracoccidioides brasiliensis]
MPSLLISVLFLHIAIYIINTIAASTIDSLLWLIYMKLPTSASCIAREQHQMKQEVVQLKREMNATSSQDEFAKWAKLRRRHDKALEEYEVKNKQFSRFKSFFDVAVKALRWAGTSGLIVFLQFWFSKTPIFTLPPSWIPWQVEWVLSFPRAPMGTVSIQVWGGACAVVVALIGEAIGATVRYLYASKDSMEAIKVGAGAVEKEKKRQ